MKNIIILLVLVYVASQISSCALLGQRDRQFIPRSVKKIRCIERFINRDIEIGKANKVCESIYKEL